jgi:hypothetical protein
MDRIGRIKEKPSSSRAFSFILSILSILFEFRFLKLNHYRSSPAVDTQGGQFLYYALFQ